MKSRISKWIIAVALLLTLLLTSAGCSNNGREMPDTGGDKDSLRMAWLTAYSTIDPHYIAADSDFTLCALIYESFYSIDSLGNGDPRLAESYDVSDDGLTYTYNLKKAK